MDEGPVPASDRIPDMRLSTKGSQENRDLVSARRRIAGYLYFIKRWAQPKIVDYLSTKHEPRMPCNLSTVCRDIQFARALFRQTYNARGFDALTELGTRIERYEMAAAMAWREFETAPDARTRVLALRVYRECNKEATTLLQDVGLLDRRIGTIVLDDPNDKAGRIPNAVELHKRFEAVNVKEGELVSEAEKAYLYGDAAASEAAARDADHAG
jgi:hypothetical protein